MDWLLLVLCFGLFLICVLGWLLAVWVIVDMFVCVIAVVSLSCVLFWVECNSVVC